jgi:hypothetical protein
MVFFYKISFNLWYGNKKEPEPQFVIAAAAPGGNLISAPRLTARLRFHNTAETRIKGPDPHKSKFI